MEATSPKVSFTRAEDLGTEVLNITIGPKRKHFVIHKQLLISQSAFFRRVFNRLDVENKNTIHFDKPNPPAIALFVEWIYRGKIPGVAEMEKKIQLSLSSGSSVPSRSTSNGNSVPGELPHNRLDQAALERPAPLEPPVPLEQVPAIMPLSEFRHSSNLDQRIKSEPRRSSLAQSTPKAPREHPELFSNVASSKPSERTSSTTFEHSGPSPLGQSSQSPTPVFSHPHQNTSTGPHSISTPEASAASKTASSLDRERDEFQVALFELCFFASEIKCPALFNQAIESYCRIAAHQALSWQEVALPFKSTMPRVLPLREYMIDRMAEQAGGDGHLPYIQAALKAPDLTIELLQKLRFPASIPRNGHAENSAINPYEKYHMRDVVDG